jgi:predicted PurR-regulated permease PerM
MYYPEKTEPDAPADNDLTSASHLRTFVLLVATLGGIYLCLRMIGPFVGPLAWAFTLAAIFLPFQAWLERRVRSPSLAAMIAVAVIGAMVVVPVFFVGQRLVLQAADGAVMLDEMVQSGELADGFEAQARRIPLVDRFAEELDLAGAASTITAWLSERAGAFLAGSVFQLVAFCLTLYVLFFLLRDRRQAIRSIHSLVPLTRAEMARLSRRINDTIHATVYGTLAVSVVQGALGGLMFWWLGLPSPLLWGVVMAILAVVPVLGSFVVWLPAALYLGIEGHWIKALILAAWGVLVVGTVDNLLRPILVGKRLEQHTVLAFFSVVGGLILFGASGLILGPLVLTITTVLLEIWAGRKNGKGDQENGGEGDGDGKDEDEEAEETAGRLGPPLLAPARVGPRALGGDQPLETSSPPER